MAVEKAAAEQELIGLLEEAIIKVKHVRYDHVEEVSKLFEEAYQYLEANVMIDERNFDTNNFLVDRAQMQEEKLQSKSDVFIPKNGLQGLPITRNVTPDYSSPSLPKRSLIIAGRAKRGQSSRAEKSSSRRTPTEEAKSDTSGDEDDEAPARNIGLGLSRTVPESGMMKQLPKHKLVHGAKGIFTRDTSSPSLGSRSLQRSAAPTGGGFGLVLGLGHQRTKGFPGFSARKAMLPSEFDTENDVAIAPAAEASLKKQQSLPGASPAMMKTSRNLIAMASPVQSSRQQKTPKPSFLKRLDSLDTNNAKLIKARKDLTELIKKCKGLVSRMNMEKYAMIKNKFDKALERLDQGKIVERVPETNF